MQKKIHLKKFRESQNLSQDALARKAMVTQEYISQIENGKRFPSLRTLEKLSKALKCTKSDLLGESANNT